MIYDKKTRIWSITLYLKLGKFKFRQGGSWDNNLGGSNLSHLILGGGDFTVTENGQYTVALDAIAKSATIQKVE